MRIALGVQYDGSRFRGWQRQEHAASIQEALETALSQVANTPIEVQCAGRTDACVHAFEQVAHFDTSVERSDHAWVFGANRFLPEAISVLWVKPVSDDFHARYSAFKRHYRYVIYNHPIRPALNRAYLTHYYYPLDELKMQEAARYLLGEHDFSAFRSAECEAKSPMRCVELIEIKRVGRLVIVDIAANAFLHHMVRNIVGTLMLVGQGKEPVEWVQSVLESRDRTLAGPTAAPNGLALMRIEYPPVFDLPQSKADNNDFVSAGFPFLR